MNIARILTALACLAVPGVAAAETYQLWMEQFDEGRRTTICKYESGHGNMEVTEYSGRFLCPRVACELPPPSTGDAGQECLTAGPNRRS